MVRKEKDMPQRNPRPDQKKGKPTTKKKKEGPQRHPEGWLNWRLKDEEMQMGAQVQTNVKNHSKENSFSSRLIEKPKARQL